MQLIRHHDLFRKNKPSYNNCPPESNGSVIALGNFDGVHQGHKIVIQEAIKIAKEKKLPSAVMTFEPHPMMVLLHRPIPLRITTFRQKFRLIEKLGIDYMFALNFNNEFSTLPAHDFVEKVLVEHLKVKHIVIGDDFIFGHARRGNIEFLRDMSKSHNFEITQIDAVTHKEESSRYSSSAIRDLIKIGKIGKASKRMGHDFIIEGRVINGQKRGRTIGTPTANIHLNNYIHPLFGVYLCQTKVAGIWYNSICNIGNKPTIGSDADLLEVHIFDFDKDIYGQLIEVKLIKFIRNEQKFERVDLLREQIDNDIATAKKYFGKNND